MKNQRKKTAAFILSIIAVLGASASIIAAVIGLYGSKMDFKAQFYLLYYAEEEHAVSAAALSLGVFNCGGAGYVFRSGGKYYVTVACYYREEDANKVKNTLLNNGEECEILKLETDGYRVKSKKDEKLYMGNLNTLYTLSKTCYDCANALDDGKYTQEAAKKVLDDAETCLKGLKKANEGNPFFEECERLIAQKRTVAGYVYSKDVRALQIAIVDTIVNIELM